MIHMNYVVHKYLHFLLPMRHRQEYMSMLAGTQCVDRSWEALKDHLPQKGVDEGSTHKVPQSLLRKPSPRVGLAYPKEPGPLERKDLLEGRSSLLACCRSGQKEFADIQHRRRIETHGMR